MNYKKFSFILIILSLLIIGPNTQAATNLSGKIVLQVQDHGQAWYISPINKQRYFLGNSAESLKILTKLGLGISNYDFKAILKSVPTRLLGRILIKVEDRGKAYYIDPTNKKMYPLEKPGDVVNLIKSRGLGINNANLAKIVIAKNNTSPATVKAPSSTTATTSSNLVGEKSVTYTWKYKNKSYSLTETLNTNLYKRYSDSPKSFIYSSNNPPANPRDSFYKMFITPKSNDNSIDKILSDLKSLALGDNYQSDQLAEFVLAFVQYIPYDQARANSNNLQANYPYETLYQKSGICSDKSFLANLLLRHLGYGSVIFDFPDANHSAVGIQCPVNDSTYGSGYCFVETTNFLPISILPQSINAGVASSSNQISQVFNTNNLGRVEYYQKTTGKIYSGANTVKTQVFAIQSLENTIDSKKEELATLKSALDVAKNAMLNLKQQLDNYKNSNDFKNYNDFVPVYNTSVVKYNSQLSSYQAKIDAYNLDVLKYNQAQKELFQK
ncbi:MAG: transglutaminase-like domain-containing protein [Patescibacteria group bacterium]